MELLPTTPNLPEGSDPGVRDYDPIRTQNLGWMKAQNGKQPGDPVASARAIVDVVRGEVDPASEASVISSPDSPSAKSGGWPDLDFLVLGSDAEQNIREKCERVVRNLDEWKGVVRSIDLKD